MSESNIFGVSVRALIAFMLVFTTCAMSILKIGIDEPMYTLVMVAVSFYLGSKTSQMGGEKNEKNNNSINVTADASSLPSSGVKS